MKKQKTIILILFFTIFSLQTFSQTDNPNTDDQEELRVILKKCAEYCEKLSNSVLDFICIEKITETIKPIITTKR